MRRTNIYSDLVLTLVHLLENVCHKVGYNCGPYLIKHFPFPHKSYSLSKMVLRHAPLPIQSWGLESALHSVMNWTWARERHFRRAKAEQEWVASKQWACSTGETLKMQCKVGPARALQIRVGRDFAWRYRGDFRVCRSWKVLATLCKLEIKFYPTGTAVRKILCINNLFFRYF